MEVEEEAVAEEEVRDNIMERIIIGLTGPAAGGKGVVAKHLEAGGFEYFSLSDVIRAQATKYGWNHTREVLQNLGDEMRAKGGADILARLTAETSRFKHANMIVIDSIRHPDEINYLKDYFDAKIIGITASAEKLFELMSLRGRDGDPKIFEDFLMVQEREQGKEGGTAMQVNKCLEFADKLIWNDGNIEELVGKTKIILGELGINVLASPKEHEHVHREHEH